MAEMLIVIPIFMGLFLVLTGLFPRVHPGAERAVASRAGKKDSLSARFVRGLAVKILPFISLEDTKRQNLARPLGILGEDGSPELFEAKAWAAGALYALSALLAAPVFHLALALLLPDIGPAAIYQAGGVLAVILLFFFRNMELKSLEKRVKSRREAIEWELPQFSGTVLQSLGHTRSVIDILESYRKICGPALGSEIDQTLNEMRTGNHETAVKNLAGRVNSGAFTQLAQGLIGLLRGDDQRNYFQIITKDFSKSQQELMRKELLARPDRLVINNILLLFCMVLMLMVAIGSHLMDAGAGLF